VIVPLFLVSFEPMALHYGGHLLTFSVYRFVLGNVIMVAVVSVDGLVWLGHLWVRCGFTACNRCRRSDFGGGSAKVFDASEWWCLPSLMSFSSHQTEISEGPFFTAYFAPPGLYPLSISFCSRSRLSRGVKRCGA